MPPKTFKQEVDILLQKIDTFITKYNPNLEAHKVHSDRYQKLTQLHTILSKELESKTITTQPAIDYANNNCTIKAIKILKPNLFAGAIRASFPKTTVFIQIETEETDCIFTETEATLEFSDNTNAKALLNSKNQNGKVISASLVIDFSAYPDKTTAIVKIGNASSSPIYYAKHASIDLSSSTSAKETVKNFKWWSEALYPNSNASLADFKAVCPNLKMSEGKYFKMSDFKTELDKNQDIKNIESNSIDLKKLSIVDLESLKTKYQLISDSLQLVAAKFEYNSGILDDLEEQYNGKDSKSIFDAVYKQQVQNNATILTFIKTKETTLELFISSIENELNRQSIPQDLVSQAAALNSLMQQQIPTFTALEEESENYHNEKIILSTFQEWKDMLARINGECTRLQQEWDTLWTPFYQAVQNYEANPNTLKNKYYTEWKGSDYGRLLEYLSSDDKKTIYSITIIKYNLAKFQTAIDQTGGDGKLEFVTGEDYLSTDEEQHFTKQPTGIEVNTFPFEDTKLPLVDATDGLAADDIQQGEVGDCYLMAALISLTKDNQDLIKSMIVPNGDKYIVTLYKEGIPVQVEVDKKLVVRKIANYSDSRPTAQALDDIWVPIIEKAYAKLFGSTSKDLGGNFLKIEGGNSADALKSLLGNRVKTPTEIYLDDKGNIVTANPVTTVSNPVKLSNITEATLALLIQATNKAKYEIHVSSPDKYNGVSLGDHDIIPIDTSNYMSFNHAYSLVNATKNDVTIRNPHGNSEQEQGIFSEQVKSEVRDLVQATIDIEKEFISTQKITKKSKNEYGYCY